MDGFEIIDFNLVPEQDRRANSLIFVATPKESQFACRAVKVGTPGDFSRLDSYECVEANIRRGILNLESFVDRVTAQGQKVAGYGAGGRGVMALAAMRNVDKFRYLVDKKPKRQGLVAPKSGVPLAGVDRLKAEPVDEILVFSFGYMGEIQSELSALGYQPAQFHSLLDVLAGRF
jgi:hypothetical protein